MFDEEGLSTVFIVLFGVTLLIVLALVFLFLVFNTRKNKLINQNLALALQSQKRQHELELKALRGQMNPHFVHNSLNAIQYFIQRNDVETSENYLAKFSKLMRQFFDYSRRKHVTLTEEVSLLENYLQIEKLRFEDKLDFEITISNQLDTDSRSIPSMLLQPLIENAINHGLFHKKGKGKVTLSINPINETSYEVVIADDGVGVKQAKTYNTTIKGTKASHSSEVLQERIHFINEGSRFSVSYQIEDCFIKINNNTGTKVILIITEDYEQD